MARRGELPWTQPFWLSALSFVPNHGEQLREHSSNSGNCQGAGSAGLGVGRERGDPVAVDDSRTVADLVVSVRRLGPHAGGDRSKRSETLWGNGNPIKALS